MIIIMLAFRQYSVRTADSLLHDFGAIYGIQYIYYMENTGPIFCVGGRLYPARYSTGSHRRMSAALAWILTEMLGPAIYIYIYIYMVIYLIAPGC